MAFTLLDATKKVAYRARPEYKQLKEQGETFLELNFHNITQQMTPPVFLDETYEGEWYQDLTQFFDDIKQKFFKKLSAFTTSEVTQLETDTTRDKIFSKTFSKNLFECLKTDNAISQCVKHWVAEQISNNPHYARANFLAQMEKCIPSSIGLEHKDAAQFLINFYSVTEGEGEDKLAPEIWTYLPSNKLAYLFYTTLCGVAEDHEQKFTTIVIDIICALGEHHESLEGDLPAFREAMKKLSIERQQQSQAQEVQALNQALLIPCAVDTGGDNGQFEQMMAARVPR